MAWFACYVSNTAHSVNGITLHATRRGALESAAEFYDVEPTGDDEHLYEAIVEAADAEAWYVCEVDAPQE
jgi:hypothetical protein